MFNAKWCVHIWLLTWSQVREEQLPVYQDIEGDWTEKPALIT